MHIGNYLYCIYTGNYCILYHATADEINSWWPIEQLWPPETCENSGLPMLLAIAMLVHVAIGRLYVHGCTDHGPPGTRPEEANRSLINGHFRDLKRRYLPFLEAYGLNFREYHRTIWPKMYSSFILGSRNTHRIKTTKVDSGSAAGPSLLVSSLYRNHEGLDLPLP